MALNAKHLALIRIWKKAYGEGRTERAFADHLTAVKVRWAMYNMRPESLPDDHEFRLARESCTIRWKDERTLEVVRVDKDAAFDELLEWLGEGDEEAARLGQEEKEMRESEARIMLVRREEPEPEPEIPDYIKEIARKKFGAR